MTLSKKLLSLVIASVAASSMVNADSILVGSIAADDEHKTYISTADNVAGTLIASGDNWRNAASITTTLAEGQDYYLHVHVKDKYQVIAGFLGSFSLTGNHTFANGSKSLLTNSTDWKVSKTTWGTYTSAVELGRNGDAVFPWKRVIAGVDADANWIWTEAGQLGEGYFSVKIEASEVPVPAAAWLFGSAILGLAGVKRKS